MARKSRYEPRVNHDRWLVSYADFITILLGFFVVMYSISSVNEGKYQVLSDSLGSAFGKARPDIDSINLAMLEVTAATDAERETTGKSTSEIMIPLLLEHQQDAMAEPREDVGEPVPAGDSQSFTEKILNQAEAEIDDIATDVEDEMVELIEDDIINIKRNKFWLEVEVKTSLLYDSGSSEILPASVPVMLKLSNIFSKLPNKIHVEGFTDDRPIRTRIFPSNWELSAARAAAVVRLFEQNGVDPSRMASIGYGQYHAIADNSTAEGRAKNRRVVMIVMAALEGQDSDRVYEFELLKEQAEGLGDS